MNDYAFPLDDGVHRGMTLRDYFAAKAMAAILSGMSASKEMALMAQSVWKKKGISDVEYFSEAAYRYADAMMEARK